MPHSADNAARLRSLLACVATAAAALLAGSASALADGASISVTTAGGQPDAVAYIPRVFTISGTAAAGKHLYVKHRAEGGAGCAPSAFADPGTWPDASFYGPAVSGSFSFQRTLAWGSPGRWTFCYWLASSETTVTPPITQTVEFREPSGAIAASVYPAVPRPDQQSQITVTGTTEASRRVYAKVRPVDGTPCGASYDADPGSGLIGGWSVDGAFTIHANTTQSMVGAYLICLWLAGASDDTLPIGGPRAQTFSVARPPRPRVESATVLDCRTSRRVGRVRARKIKSVCLRYRFSTPPAAGLSVSVAYVTPRHVTYKTVTTMWPGGASTTLTSKGLPARAYKHRRGTWFAVLRVDGAWIKTTALHLR